LKAKGFINIGLIGDPGEVFSNHIITGFMVAFASYLAGLYVIQHKERIRFIYLFIYLLTSYQLIFINNGRTGYLLYVVLMLLLIIQKLHMRQALIGIMLFCGLFSFCYYESSVMYERVNILINEVKMYKQNHKETSWGYRIQFHNYAKTLFYEHPILGIGTGGFKDRFYQDNPIPQWGRDLTEPHSQYWLLLSENGLIGFVLFLFFLGSLFLTSLQLKETKAIILGILISFCIGCLSDTLLCYSTVGYLLIVFSALCFGELLEMHILKQATEGQSSHLKNDGSINAITI